MGLRLAVVAFFATVLATMSGAGAEEAYPSRPIRLIVPYSAGGASDVMARYFGQKLTELWKANVVIENMAAAAGTVAYTTVARAQADGYTLAYGTSSIAVNAALRTKSPYDPVKDFRPISSLLVVQNVLVVPVSLPVKSVAELVALAKQRPGALNYVSLGPGSTPHLSMELFRSTAGITVQQVQAHHASLYRPDRRPRAALARVDAERIAVHSIGKAAGACGRGSGALGGAARRADADRGRSS